MLKKYQMAIFISLIPLFAHSASNLKFSSFKTGKILAEITVSKTPTSKPYYLFNYDFVVRGVSLICKTTGVLKAQYSTYFRSYYIIESPGGCDVNSAITAATAKVTFEACEDNTFKNCSVIETRDFDVKYNNDTITEVTPNKWEVTL
jgi:hypothetical protein